MPASLTRHLIALAALVAVGVPIFAIDWMLLGPTGGGWAAMDFRGWLIGSYGAYAVLVWAVSGLIAFAVRPKLIGCVAYGATAAGVAALLVGAFGLWWFVDNLESERRWAAEDAVLLEETERVGEGVGVSGWSISGDEVTVSLASSVARQICDWSLTGHVEYRQDVSTTYDEYSTCDTDEAHRPLPAGGTDLRRAITVMDGRSIEGIERWTIEVVIVGAAGQVVLRWETDATEELIAGYWTRRLQPPD